MRKVFKAKLNLITTRIIEKGEGYQITCDGSNHHRKDSNGYHLEGKCYCKEMKGEGHGER